MQTELGKSNALISEEIKPLLLKIELLLNKLVLPSLKLVITKRQLIMLNVQ